MIISGGSRGKWKRFAVHLANTKDNDGGVRLVEVRGMSAKNIREGFAQLQPWRTWPRPETEEFYYHFNINPKKGEDLSEKQWETAGERARQQSRESQTQKALHHTEDSADIAAKRQRELDAHDRMMMRNSAEASRDALHDNGPGKEAGAYTVQEACDRAAHAPAVHRIEPDK